MQLAELSKYAVKVMISAQLEQEYVDAVKPGPASEACCEQVPTLP